jgi:hypothetical protein
LIEKKHEQLVTLMKKLMPTKRLKHNKNPWGINLLHHPQPVLIKAKLEAPV